MARAVVRRRLADDLPEHAAERPQAGEADIHADVGHAAVRLAQKEHRALHPPPLQVAVRRLPEDGAEAADEVRLGDEGHRGHGADVERLGIGAVHRIAGAQQSPVQILGFATHGATLRHTGTVRSARQDGPELAQDPGGRAPHREPVDVVRPVAERPVADRPLDDLDRGAGQEALDRRLDDPGDLRR